MTRRSLRPISMAIVLAAVLMFAVPVLAAPGSPSADVGFRAPLTGAGAVARAAGAPVASKTVGMMQIPGAVALPASPVTGSVSQSQSDDLYKVDLVAGEALNLRLNLSPSTYYSATKNIDIFVFNSSAPDIYFASLEEPGAPIAVSWFPGIGIYPETLTFVAPTTGTYTIDVWAEAGSSSYTIDYAKWTANEDDTMPGVAVSPSPFVSTVDEILDPEDYYAFASPANYQQQVRADSDDISDIDLVVLDSKRNFNVKPYLPIDADYSAGSDSFVYWDQLSTDPVTRTVLVHTFEGLGTYEMSYDLWHAPKLTRVQSASTISYGGSVRLSGVLSDRLTSAVASDYPVYLWSSSNDWDQPIADKTTTSAGAYSFTVKPTANTKYGLAMYGDVDPGGLDTPSPPEQSVSVKAYLTKPSVVSTMFHGKSYPVSGYIKPRHARYGHSVVVKAYKKVSGKWVFKRSYTTTNYDYSSTTSKYKGSVKLPYAGSWRLCAYHADSTHAANASSYTYVTAK